MEQRAVIETIVIRHHGMIVVPLDDVIPALLRSGGGVPAIVDREVDTAQFMGDADTVSWDAAHGYVWRRANELRTLTSNKAGGRVAYFGGFPEVPLAVALGAYLGEELPLEFFDRHRGVGWAWPADTKALTLAMVGAPRDRVTSAAPAVLRIELSSSVEESLIREFISDTEETAHIRIRPEGQDPRVGIVQSKRDLEEVRRVTREALAVLHEQRPNVTAVHLFLAAQPSACVAIGQELRLRNFAGVETYRHRRTPEGTSTLTSAIRLSVAGPSPADIPPTDEERGVAATLRKSVWEGALNEVEAYAAMHRARTDDGRWYSALEPLSAEMAQLAPFPALPGVHRVVPEGSTVAEVSMEPPGLYGYARDVRVWRVNDGFLLRLHRAYERDESVMRELVRIFMFHESLHLTHGITKAKVEEVGKFACGLEYVDYMADLYAILHELDRAWKAEAARGARGDFSSLKDRVARLIDVVIRSFWAFEPEEPQDRMEMRRLRRYLNWYWQWIRVRMSRSPLELAAVLARKPIVEIAGLDPSVESRRYYGSLRRFDARVGLEMAIVLDDEELRRIPTSVTVPIHEVIAAFREKSHGEIQQFFRKVFDEIGDSRALPTKF